MKINDQMHYLWRAVDQEGEVLESLASRTRDKAAALTSMKKIMKRHGRAKAITTDGLCSYKATMKSLGNAGKQEIGRWANNRVENSSPALSTTRAGHAKVPADGLLHTEEGPKAEPNRFGLTKPTKGSSPQH